MEAEVTPKQPKMVRAWCHQCLGDRKHHVLPQDYVYEPDGYWRPALQCRDCGCILLRPK